MDRTAKIDNETGNKDEQLNFEELESERAGSSKQTKNNTNNKIKNQWFHLSKPLQNIKLPVDLYVKCVFNKVINFSIHERK